MHVVVVFDQQQSPHHLINKYFCFNASMLRKHICHDAANGARLVKRQQSSPSNRKNNSL